MTSRLSRQGGFTLVESIVVIAVGAIVMAAIFPVFLLLYRIETAWGANTQARASGLLAEDSLVRDLRAYHVETLKPLVLRAAGDPNFSVTYSVDAGRLIREVNGTSTSRSVVAHGIRAVSVSCSGNPATLRLAITSAGLSGTDVPLTPDLLVTPRNQQGCPSQ